MTEPLTPKNNPDITPLIPMAFRYHKEIVRLQKLLLKDLAVPAELVGSPSPKGSKE